MKKYFGVFITLLSAMLLCVLPAKAGSAYSPETAVNFARNHFASNHTEHHNNCPNGWICAEFTANCVKAGGIDITPSKQRFTMHHLLHVQMTGIQGILTVKTAMLCSHTAVLSQRQNIYGTPVL